jgi:hypothetical protein
MAEGRIWSCRRCSGRTLLYMSCILLYRRHIVCTQFDILKHRSSVKRNQKWEKKRFVPWQSPILVWKKPGAHFEHKVPSLPVVKPLLHAHWPLLPQTPFWQLHDEGELLTLGFRHLPVPVIPSSQESQFAGPAWHLGPKNPAEHVSHEAPVNPAEHLHVPAAVHIPALEHAGEHAADWMSCIDRDPKLDAGSWEKSGTASHTMNRFEVVLRATQTLGDSTRESAEIGVEMLELGVEGRLVKEADPEYEGLLYCDSPGWSWRLKGNDMGLETLNPAVETTDGEDEVMTS